MVDAVSRTEITWKSINIKDTKHVLCSVSCDNFQGIPYPPFFNLRLQQDILVWINFMISKLAEVNQNSGEYIY